MGLLKSERRARHLHGSQPPTPGHVGGGDIPVKAPPLHPPSNWVRGYPEHPDRPPSPAEIEAAKAAWAAAAARVAVPQAAPSVAPPPPPLGRPPNYTPFDGYEVDGSMAAAAADTLLPDRI